LFPTAFELGEAKQREEREAKRPKRHEQVTDPHKFEQTPTPFGRLVPVRVPGIYELGDEVGVGISIPGSMSDSEDCEDQADDERT
jgi:hypothetical protein